MILANTDYVTGKTLNMLELIKESTIQTKNIGKDISQGFKALTGGELEVYSETMDEARVLTTKQAVEEAETLGTDAIVNIHYVPSAIMDGVSEVIAYGTAVTFL